MKRSYFYNIESCEHATEFDLNEVTEQLAFDSKGLLPVITQDFATKEVLMMAWMNKEALTKTLESGLVTYWSRSRQQFWVKGETSGHTQELKSLSIDCDGDTILCQVNQTGAACHTGRKNCFYLAVDNEAQKVRVVGNQPS